LSNFRKKNNSPCELNPQVDRGYTRKSNANRIVQECMIGIEMRKIGISDCENLTPLTADDARTGA
jgi:hypothetical protein